MSDRIYTTEAKIAAYINESIVSGATADFILAAQAMIERYTGRIFKADSAASARLFNGNDTQALRIDECVEVSKVEVGNNQWGDDFTEIENVGGQTPGYYLLPANYAANSLPVSKIGLRSMIWIDGHANHRITAKWGFSANVPSDISWAATVIAAGMYFFNKGKTSGAIKSEKTLNYSVSYSDDGGFKDFERASQILDSYKLFEI